MTLAAASALAVGISDEDNAGNGRLSACDTDRGEPVCLDKMASYSACLGPELAERFKTAAAQCYFGANEGDNEEDEEVSEEVVEDRQRPSKGKGKKGKRGKRGKRGENGRRRRGGKGKGRPGKGRPGKGRPGKGRPAEESSESEETEDEVFNVVDFVR